MGRTGVLALSCSVLIGPAAVAGAQDLFSPESAPAEIAASVSLSEDQDRELATWFAAMERWQRYDTKWDNRPVRDVWARIVARKPPPTAPAWLAAHCAAAASDGLVDLAGRTTQACRLLADPRAAITAAPSAVPSVEKPPKHSMFLNRVHFDWLWSTTASGSRFYGLIGSHLTLVDVGRLQIFGPPGVLVLSVPNGEGGRRLTIGYTWGVSVRLTDLRVASSTRNATLFLNVAKVWVDGAPNLDGHTPGFDIVGFSIAPRKTH
jgi:hypothetical protein